MRQVGAFRGFLVGLGLLLSSLPCAAAPIRGIWLSAAEGEAGASNTIRSVANAGIDTIFLLVFSDGQTAYPSRVFPQREELRGSDPVAAFLGLAKERGIKVFAALDVLYWQRPGAQSPVVTSHPERMERNAEGEIVGDEGAPGGAFASPASPQVTSLLQQLVAELASKYSFDGIAFDYARLSRGEYLGFSKVARKAFFSAQGVDPADIDPLGFATDLEVRQRFATWLEGQVNSIVEQLSSAFKRVKPDGKVAAVALAGYYEDRLNKPARQDWMTWGQKGWVDILIAQDLILSDPEYAKAQLARLNRLDKVTILTVVSQMPAGPVVAQADSLGLAGTVLWPGNSRPRRRAMLREFVAW